jgi:hypothetical protein
MKNEFSKNRKKIFPSWNYFLWMFIVVLVACNTTNDSKSYDFDPSKEVTITEFSPKSGSAHSKLFIYGNNLGVDTAKIKVYIGGEKAPVIGCDGECIYCLVPAHSEEGSIEVKVKDGTTEKIGKSI